jgi:hypothetical protein
MENTPMRIGHIAFFAVVILGLLLSVTIAQAEIHRWRVGDEKHPWVLAPVSGRSSWGQGWAVEVIADDDGDGLVDEDPVEFIDDDGDGLINEDGPDPQVDDDGDGQSGEDPANRLDDDGDGLIDEDPIEAFDSDYDGLVDEDGPDPQLDNDGDGFLNEDGPMTDGDDDFDALSNEDPANGVDDDGDGLIDEDGPFPEKGRSATTWVQSVRLGPNRNLARVVHDRFLEGVYGGVPGTGRENPVVIVPNEYGFRLEGAKPVGYEEMIDGNLSTGHGSDNGGGSIGISLKGFFFIDRIFFRPRSTMPGATVTDYLIQYGDPTTIDPVGAGLRTSKILVSQVSGQAFPTVKEIVLADPVLMGNLWVRSTSRGPYAETAELGVFGDGFAQDGIFISEMIDVGAAIPRIRRYSQQWDLFGAGEQGRAEKEFPVLEGGEVNWGKVRWKGRRTGEGGDIRIQFRTGNSLDTHIYARRLGPGLVDERDTEGKLLDAFAWAQLLDGRIEEKDLRYNELGIDLGPDGRDGWTYWSAPFKLEDGKIDENLPPERWREQGIFLPLPGGTRYIQFRIFFDSTRESGCALDFVEFDYGTRLVGGGVMAEIYPTRAELGKETTFHYFLRPSFVRGEQGGFNRIEIDMPSAEARLDSLKFDGFPWDEIRFVGQDDVVGDPLQDVEPKLPEATEENPYPIGQFAQRVVVNPVSGKPRLELKLPMMEGRHFEAGENIEIVFSDRLFRGAERFEGVVWNDSERDRQEIIPQSIEEGDAVADVSTDAVGVVVENIGDILVGPRVHPNPFTPNGDGINDLIKFSFELFLVLEAVGVKIEVFDLSGRLIHIIGPEDYRAGSVELTWDGRDVNGELLSPGIYLYRLRVGVERADGGQMGALSLVY